MTLPSAAMASLGRVRGSAISGAAHWSDECKTGTMNVGRFWSLPSSP